MWRAQGMASMAGVSAVGPGAVSDREGGGQWMGDVTAAGVSSSQPVTETDSLIARMERLPFTKKHWAVGAVLFSATFFDGYSNLMIGTALPLIVASLHFSLLQAGVLLSAAFWGQTLGAPLAGIVAEKIGRRNVLLITTVLIGIPAFAAAGAQDLHQLI